MSSETEQVKPKWLEKTGQWYVKSKTVRSLMQIAGTVSFGGTSALDSAIALKVEDIRGGRLRTFFEELDKGETELTEEQIKTEDFLHAFFATTKAALNTRRRDKIRMFAGVLNSYGAKYEEMSIDEYEVYLNILDELSLREFRTMVLYEEYFNRAEKGFQGDPKDDAEIVNTFWKEFLAKLASQYDVTDDEVHAMLVRLQRTGCYRLFGS